MAQSNRLQQLLYEKGYLKKDAKVIIKDVFDCITQLLIEEENVQIHKFGTFYIHASESRRGTNPQTHELLMVPASKCPKFTSSISLKELINEKKVISTDKEIVE